MRKVFVNELRKFHTLSHSQSQSGKRAMQIFKAALGVMKATKPCWDAVHTLCDSFIWPLVMDEHTLRRGSNAEMDRNKRSLLCTLIGGTANPENAMALKFEYISRDFGVVSVNGL